MRLRQRSIRQRPTTSELRGNVNLFAIRHGETAWSLSGQHTGTTDIPLTENGRQVAARVDRVIARSRAAGGDIALFAHGHVLRVLVARWIGLPAGCGQHFLLDTGTLCVLGDYRGIPAVRVWNGPLTG